MSCPVRPGGDPGQVALFPETVEAGKTRRRVLADPVGARIWLRAMEPERAEWIARATLDELAQAVEVALAEELLTCPTCGAQVVKRWQTHKYCSKACWASEVAKRERHFVIRICAGCGARIETSRPWQRWCAACRRRNRHRKAVAGKAAMSDG